MFSNDKRIRPYVYKGLRGRYILQSAVRTTAKRVFLVIYGQHATIERLLPTVEALSQYGTVYLVDTPGFGGMESPYRVGEQPTLNFYDGHLKHIFDTLLPRDKRITIFGISYGLQLASHFLAHHPDYVERIEDVVSFVGLVSHTNFRISPSLEFTLKYLACGPGRYPAGAWVYQNIILRDSILQAYYRYIMVPKKVELKGAPRTKIERYVKEQSWLWRINDPRTHAKTAWDFLFVTDLTDLRIAMPITHAGVPNDHFLDNDNVVDGLTKMYSRVDTHSIDLHGHAPVSTDEADDVLKFIPENLKTKMTMSKN